MIKNILIGIAIALAIGAVGSMDYEDAVEEQKQYCENVKAGIWPWPSDRGDFEEECGDKEQPKQTEKKLRCDRKTPCTFAKV